MRVAVGVIERSRGDQVGAVGGEGIAEAITDADACGLEGQDEVSVFVDAHGGFAWDADVEQIAAGGHGGAEGGAGSAGIRETDAAAGS